MVSTFVIAFVAFIVGAFWAKNSADKLSNFLVAEQKKHDDFYTGFIVDRALRAAYSLQWRHIMTLTHHSQDLITEIVYRASFQDKDDLSGSIEKAQDFLSCNENMLDELREEIDYLVEECKKDFTKEDYSVVEYTEDWIKKYNANVDKLKRLISEHS